MIRFLFRILATLMLAIATIMAVLDATRTVAASRLVLTPLAASWKDASPSTLAAAQAAVATHAPWLWAPLSSTVLAAPCFAVFAALAFIFYAFGRRRPRRYGRLAVE